jgi:pimeloyl-ACP methyl ester carboxylesterase
MRSIRPPGRFLLLTTIGLLTVSVLSAQVRSAALDEPSLLYRPANFREGELYPLVVFLPYTGGAAQDQARAFGITPGRQRDFFVMLPPGRFQRADYLPDFNSFVGWVEDRVVSDIESVVSSYSVDPEQVVLAGYSLGGDLSWALTVRNPMLIRGAVMAGTRASQPAGNAELSTLSRRDARIAMVIGNRESDTRYEGINRARVRADSAGISVLYREYNGGHSIPPRSVLQEALRFTLSADAESIAEREASRGEVPPADYEDDRLEPGGTLIDWSFLFRPPAGFVEIRYLPPLVFSQGGDVASGLHRFDIDYQVNPVGIRISGSTGYASTLTTSGLRLAHIPQRIVVGVDGDASWRVGVTWSWYSFFEGSPETAASRRFALIGGTSHGGGTLPLAGVAAASVRAPLSLTAFRLLDVANLELSYELSIADSVIVDLGLASFAEQNQPAATLQELADRLDHVVRWQVGLAVRYPTRLRWGLTYTGESRRRIIVSGDSAVRHLVQLQLGYLF